MNPLSPRSRWTLILLLVCMTMTAMLWATRGWIWLGVTPINAERTPWSDTLIHLAAAVNCADDLGEWHGRVCFVPSIESSPRAQTYEPWLTLHRLGVDDETDVLVAAILIVVTFIAALALTLRPRNARQALLGWLVFSTAAVQLGIERGNFDLLIAAMICLAGALLAQPRLSSSVAGIGMLSLTTMLKLYTGLACGLAWLMARAPRRWTLPVSIIALVLAVAVVGPRELLILGEGAPEGATRFSTGARWLFLHAGKGWGIAAILTSAIAAGSAWRQLSTVATPRFERWPRRLAVFQIAFLTAVPLFLLKDSYDYRLVLWLPCLALPFAWLHDETVDRAWRRLAIAIIALFVYVAGVELPCTWLDALAQTTGARWPALLTNVLAYGKQFAAWTLAALLTVLFAMIVRTREYRKQHPQPIAASSSRSPETRL